MTIRTETGRDTQAVAASGRLNIRINADTARALTNLAGDGQRTASEVVRRALLLLDLVEQETAHGKHIELVSSDGKTRQQVRFL